MRETKRQLIKPLFTRSIMITNLAKYQDLIRRRDKTTFNFNFSCPEEVSSFANIEIQNKLLKALKFLRVLKATETHHRISHKTLAIYKRLSKVKSISVQVNQGAYSLLFTNFKEKWLRYMPALRYLDYEIAENSRPRIHDLQEIRNAGQVQHPLRDIKYCPKIHSLQVKVPYFATHFYRSLYNFKHYSSKIKRLSISPEYTLTKDPNSSIDCLKSLQFFQLKLQQRYCPGFTIRNINALLNLANLQELDLQFFDTVLPEVYPALTKMSKRGVLKKLKLNFLPDSQLTKALEALKDCQLTHFSLDTALSEEKMIELIAKFLQGKTKLECLELLIINHYRLTSRNIFEDLYKTINNLPALKNLSLNFRTGYKSILKLALVSYLQPILSKLEALSLKCNYANPSKEYTNLMTGLEGSADSLQKLTIDFGTYCPTKQVHDGIISFVRSLKNIRELQLPNFDISAQKLLHDIAQAVYGLKSLRLLVVGNIKGTVSRPRFLNAVENIVKKRGLVKFKYSVTSDFKETIMKEMKTAPRIDLRKVQKLNPALEVSRYIKFVFDDDSIDTTWQTINQEYYSE